ncbi:HD domain-containing protein [Rhodobacter sp. Har01]|uniref:HD domain-containing protein n=1 Tax=Rhodobacter sp. Har01 TaxID=2883999 RepID=UPI001D093E08|nr:HD domain-containing protein [Rhodobacter sp. Har01]MCB6176962.1 HD domain-containing protein [Rhodobacter sp. Har01]
MTIEKARRFAEDAHAGQTRKGAAGEPYSVHLQEVAALVAAAGGSVTAVMAAWLHDTVEDCRIAPATLADLFGPEVAAVVAELTDDKALPKPVRKRQQQLNAPRKSPEAALVKIADKLSNIRALAVSPPATWPLSRKLDYLDWACSVVAALPAGADPLRADFAAQLAASRAAVRSGAAVEG